MPFLLAEILNFQGLDTLFNMGILKKYQVGRIFAWKEPESFKDTAYQTLQSIYAIGSGKLFGRGYLNSFQKNSYT